MAVYLRNYQLVPVARTIELFRDILGVNISEGTIINMTKRYAGHLSGFMEMVKLQLIDAKVMHNDETGINILGKLHWLHTTGNKEFTFLAPHKRRGSVAFDEIRILPHFNGVSVHDFW